MSELDYMDALAAEYVLGTLDVEERTQARSLLGADEEFAAKVQLWERRFGDLHLMVEPVEPDSAIWTRIRAKMAQSREQIYASEAPIPPSAAETKTAESPSPAAAAPPSLDAIEAAISNAAATLSAEATAAAATSPPQSDAMPSEVPSPVSDGTRPATEMPPAGAEASPPEREMTRPETEMTPRETEMAPRQVDATPQEAEVPSAQGEVTPQEAEVPPAQGEVTPQEAEMPPAQGEVTTQEAEVPPAQGESSGLEVTPTSVSEASPAPASEAPSAPASDAQPAPAEAIGTSAVEAVPTPPVAAAAAAVPQASETRAQAGEPAVLSLHRQLRLWRAFAILMSLLVLAVVVLLAAWRFVPDRLPAILQPLELMRHVGVGVPAASPPRRPAPPESQFDE
jgi:anti-sigma-K factor RskA